MLRSAPMYPVLNLSTFKATPVSVWFYISGMDLTAKVYACYYPRTKDRYMCEIRTERHTASLFWSIMWSWLQMYQAGDLPVKCERQLAQDVMQGLMNGSDELFAQLVRVYPDAKWGLWRTPAMIEACRGLTYIENPQYKEPGQ